MNIIAINKRSIFAVVLVLALALAMVPQGAFAKSSGNKGFSGKPSTEADEIIKVAKSKLGCPYVSGAAGPYAFDCSGFVAYCMHRVGIKLTRGSAASYYKAGYSYEMMGKLDRALEYYEYVYNDDPTFHGIADARRHVLERLEEARKRKQTGRADTRAELWWP